MIAERPLCRRFTVIQGGGRPCLACRPERSPPPIPLAETQRSGPVMMPQASSALVSREFRGNAPMSTLMCLLERSGAHATFLGASVPRRLRLAVRNPG